MNKVAVIDPKHIDLIVYDFDGVHTDDKFLVFEDGREAVFCNRADGLAIQKIKALGIPQIILSTEQNKVVEARAKKVDIEVIHGVADKKAILKDYCRKKKYTLQKVLYVGNDVNDLEAMKIVGFPVAPADSHDAIKSLAKLVTKANGGEGVIRELSDYIV